MQPSGTEVVVNSQHVLCVIITSISSCIIIFGTLSEQIYQLTFYPFLFDVLIYIYVFMFLMYCDLHA